MPADREEWSDRRSRVPPPLLLISSIPPPLFTPPLNTEYSSKLNSGRLEIRSAFSSIVPESFCVPQKPESLTLIGVFAHKVFTVKWFGLWTFLVSFMMDLLFYWISPNWNKFTNQSELFFMISCWFDLCAVPGRKKLSERWWRELLYTRKCGCCLLSICCFRLCKHELLCRSIDLKSTWHKIVEIKWLFICHLSLTFYHINAGSSLPYALTLKTMHDFIGFLSYICGVKQSIASFIACFLAEIDFKKWMK